MNIRQCTPDDAAVLARLIAEANRDVAVRFGLNADNCPKHPSFCSKDWIEADLSRGVKYFILEDGAKPIGCVAYECPASELAFLNRLSVLPEYRKRGGGTRLVHYIVAIARAASIRTVSIGVIGEHVELQRWYRDHGFVDGEVKRFPHLPFTVKYMTYAL
jgi:GNAT superfamily N-acetyltransferase